MAIFIPSFEKIKKLNVSPTEGELYLINVLSSELDNNYEVYFNPYLNGDRPDVIVFHPKRGLLIIEVKDWKLDLYCLDKNKRLKLKNKKENNFFIKSPISQVIQYK